MKRNLWILGCLAGLPGVAAELAVNKPLAEAVVSTNDTQQVAIAGAPTVAAGATLVVSAVMTFTLPTEMPAVESGVKLAIAASPEGQLLVATGGDAAWTESGYVVADQGQVAVRAVGKLDESGKLGFTVTFSPVVTEAGAVDGGSVKTVSVGGAAAGALSAFEFSGEGSTRGLTLALVEQSILPPTVAGEAQDPVMVEKYVEWVNDESLGGALAADATDAEKQDAFAMNVGGTPSLAIAAIDPETRKISVVGSYAAADGEQKPVDLAKINGVLTISSQEELGGEAVVQRVDVAAGAGETVTVTFPEKARFVKAAVSVNPAVTTETALTAE